ncbi:MAG TPA: aminotransferase class V-fold PLP-dependent enzyme [Planctomycetota bacterium]|nr:aminotransferase class V-fold PLP-dependent enzyme [Planctomycetota bacterium]
MVDEHDTGAGASALARHWALDASVTFLNHGSFGACPRPVLAAQQRWREQLEAEPVRFMVRELEPALDAARDALAAFVGARAEDLVFVPNATTAVSTVLASLSFAPGDELLTTDHAYHACRNALDRTAQRTGARVVSVRVPFPLREAEAFATALLAAAGPRTKLALVDHVTSPTGLVLPVERLVPALQARGVDVLVDGAHAPGMLPLRLDALGAAYYTGNCHKWVCAPKGAALLHVRADRQAGIRPLVTSHGATSTRTDRSRFQLEFGWTGTDDPTAALCVPEALTFLGGLLPGGWPARMEANRALARRARDILCAALAVPPPAPDAMLGSLAAVPLPDTPADAPPGPFGIDPLQEALFRDHRIEVPVMTWPAPPHRLIRVAAQAYNTAGQYERLAAALRALLPARAGAR